MPNWCDTNYAFKGANKEQTKDLFEKIESLKKMEKPLVENDFGNLWMGCLVNILGGDWDSVPCKGSIENYELKEDVLYMNCCTAWDGLYGFRRFIEQQYPGSKMFYCEIEPDNGIYNTNDLEGKYIKQKYVISSPFFQAHCETIEEMAKIIEIETGKKVEPNYAKIRKFVNDYYEKYYLELCQIHYIDDESCETKFHNIDDAIREIADGLVQLLG